jgi:hypothetical protein
LDDKHYRKEVKNQMLHNINRDLIELRNEVVTSMQETMPAKQFGADLVMATVGVHQIEARIRKTQNLEERRQLINEFYRRRKTIEKGIRLLRKDSKPGVEDSKEKLRRAMP